MKEKIKEAFGNIFTEVRLNVWSALEHQFDFVRANNGENVEG